ncbi:citrate lyase subunit beta/citryl-CoA lyase [Kibdelosporangium banguiense]|uniref:Citrate lyase subunit beta/citryl-CoA lyase n=1 Tax=Kibdelosporangium banguiense TaxID=1365924 RepID=A0ABS4TXZ9_9PSEU|nr:CoA ester lyase [Kibdelosporangium banguiense]MBP2329263.1 citrate lyase subunit beta/citryl-CoA lyase [Kibdelosporangium banguiense]
MNDLIATARTFLFVPGNRPDRFAKAAASVADVMILDLEDAVASGDKDEARDHVRAWLAEGHQAVVRINAPGTPWHDDDIDAAGGPAHAIMVPKAEDRTQLDAISRRVSGGIIPLIETALGIVQAAAICAAPSVVRPAFGSIDLAAQLGVDHQSHEALHHARSSVVLAAAATGRAAPIDGVTTAIDDEARLRTDLDHAIRLGFTGKLCVHPRQLNAANQRLTPSHQRVEWAHAVIDAAAGGAVTVHNGHMIDRPVVLRAQAILAAAKQTH